MPERLSALTESKLQEFQVADLMRMLSAKAFCPADPAGYFSEHWPRSLHRDLVTKHFETTDYEVPYQHAAIAPGTTTDAAWASPLMVPSLLRGFLPLVKAASIIGKVPFTPTPFNVKLTKQTAGGSTSWVGENTLKPVSKLAFGNLTLPWAKASSIVVPTDELVRLSEGGRAARHRARCHGQRRHAARPAGCGVVGCRSECHRARCPRWVSLADGGIDLDVSREAALVMDDAPGAVSASTVVISLYQHNDVGVRCERFMYWQVAVANAVQYLTVA